MVEVFFNSSAGRIEGLCHYSKDKDSPKVLILPPHPLRNGDMHNKVVFSLYKAFALEGFTVLRINFRGQGKSQGTFDNGIGELMDASLALEWLHTAQPGGSKLWVAGFSFGAWVAARIAMRRPEINNFVLASPPINKYDFSFFTPCPTPGLIVQGGKDSVVPEESVLEFVEKLSHQKTPEVLYKAVPEGDHFFRDHLDEVEQIVKEYVHDEINKEEKYQKSLHSKGTYGRNIRESKDTVLLD